MRIRSASKRTDCSSPDSRFQLQDAFLLQPLPRLELRRNPPQAETEDVFEGGMPGRARASQGAARGGCCVGREPLLDRAAITAGAPQGSAGFPWPLQGRAGVSLTPEGKEGGPAACPAPPQDPRREQPGSERAGRQEPGPRRRRGRARGAGGRAASPPSPATIPRPTGAEGRARLRWLSQAPQQRWRTECAVESSPSSRPTPPGPLPARPPHPSFRRALSAPLGGGETGGPGARTRQPV